MHYTIASFTFEAWMTKINCTTLGFLLLLYLLNINPLAAYNSIAGDDKSITAPTISKFSSWEPMTESDVVNAEFRWLFLNDGTKVIQRKAGMIVKDASAEEVAAIIRNYALIPQWMNAADDASLIAQPSKNLWAIFIVFELPWPLRNKYLINEVSEQKHPFLSFYTFSINSSEAYKPPFECKINDFGHYEGVWKVYSLQKDITYIEFSAFSTEPPQFPRWIQDPIINRSFTKTMENFYHLITDLH